MERCRNHKRLWFWKEKKLVVEFKTSYNSLKIAQNRRETQKRARKYWYRWKSVRTPWLPTSQLRWRWNGGGEKSTCQPGEFRRPLMLWWRKQFWFQKSNLVLVPKVDFVFQRPRRNKHTLDWGKGWTHCSRILLWGELSLCPPVIPFYQWWLIADSWEDGLTSCLSRL